jgi:hypothetical protein
LSACLLGGEIAGVATVTEELEQRSIRRAQRRPHRWTEPVHTSTAERTRRRAGCGRVLTSCRVLGRQPERRSGIQARRMQNLVANGRGHDRRLRRTAPPKHSRTRPVVGAFPNTLQLTRPLESRKCPRNQACRKIGKVGMRPKPLAAASDPVPDRRGSGCGLKRGFASHYPQSGSLNKR